MPTNSTCRFSEKTGKKTWSVPDCPRRVVLSSTNHEYVATGHFDMVDEYTHNGGRFMYTGGNGWFWAVGRLPAYPAAVESRNFHQIGERVLTNGNQGGLMVETGRKPGAVFGVEMAAMIFNGSSPYRKLEDAENPRATWIFADTTEGEIFGEYGVDRVKGGVVGFDTDKYNPGNGVPRHALHLATNEPMLPKIEDVKLGTLPLTIAYHPSPGDMWAGADMVFFETPKGTPCCRLAPSAGSARPWKTTTTTTWPRSRAMSSVASWTRNRFRLRGVVG